jgi:hypothetical protein
MSVYVTINLRVSTLNEETTTAEMLLKGEVNLRFYDKLLYEHKTNKISL